MVKNKISLEVGRKPECFFEEMKKTQTSFQEN